MACGWKGLANIIPMSTSASKKFHSNKIFGLAKLFSRHKPPWLSEQDNACWSLSRRD